MRERETERKRERKKTRKWDKRIIQTRRKKKRPLKRDTKKVINNHFEYLFFFSFSDVFVFRRMEVELDRIVVDDVQRMMRLN